MNQIHSTPCFGTNQKIKITFTFLSSWKCWKSSIHERQKVHEIPISFLIHFCFLNIPTLISYCIVYDYFCAMRGWTEWLQQRPYGQQSLKYLLPGLHRSLQTPDLAEGRGNEDSKEPLPSTKGLVAPTLEVSGPTGFCMMSFLFLAPVTGLGSRRRVLPDRHTQGPETPST